MVAVGQRTIKSRNVKKGNTAALAKRLFINAGGTSLQGRSISEWKRKLDAMDPVDVAKLAASQSAFEERFPPDPKRIRAASRRR